MANIPGLMVDDVFNNPTGGLSSPTGLLGQLTTRLPQLIAAGIVAPGAQNIFKGGTLEAGFASLSDSVDKLAAAIGGAVGIPAGATATVNALSAPKAVSAKAPSVSANVVTLDVAAPPRVAAKPASDPTDHPVAVKSTATNADSPVGTSGGSTPKPLAAKLKAKMKDRVTATVGERPDSSASGASHKKSGPRHGSKTHDRD